MSLSAIVSPLRWLFPPPGDGGEGFKQETFTLAHRGLHILAGVEIAFGLIEAANSVTAVAGIVILLAGIASAAVTRINRLYAHSRTLGVFCGLAATLAAGWGLTISGDHDIQLAALVVMGLTATAALPLLPIQSLAIGLAGVAGAWQCNHLLFLTVVAIAAAAISATLYSQRRANYESYLSVLRATEEFRSIQSRLVVAENSSTMVRLSAALAHELSQPVGIVASSIDTLLTLSARMQSATAAEQPRLIALHQELALSVKGSLDRLRVMVNRIQRLTGLDEAGTRLANVNSLLNEAAAMVRMQHEAAPLLDLQLQPVPDFECRPQQLVAVFSVLLTNSIQATPPESEGGRIDISSNLHAGRVKISISDNGSGIPADRLANIFQPGFQVTDGRVATGNWSLFTSRQFMQDHGGEMRIQSREGKGTIVTLTLPCSN